MNSAIWFTNLVIHLVKALMWGFVFLPKDGFEMPNIQSGFSKFTESSLKLFVSKSDEETISDDEENTMTSKFSTKFVKNRIVNYETEKQDEDASTWSSVLKETEDLIYLHDNAASSSSHAVKFDAGKMWKGSFSSFLSML